MSKICVKCGAELNDNALFCDDCGEKQPVQNVENESNINNQVNAAKKSVKNDRKQSGFGIASLILGIVSIITLGILLIPEILGIVFGIIGVCNKTKKRSLALAGLIMSGVMSIFIVVVVTSDTSSTDTSGTNNELAGVEETIISGVDNANDFSSAEITDNRIIEEDIQDTEVIDESNSIEETTVSNAETLDNNGKPYLVNMNLRSIYVEIAYNANFIFDGGRVTVFLDDTEIGTIDNGGQYSFDARLPIGEHTIKTKRSSNDVDTYVLAVKKGEGTACYEAQCVLLEYTYDSKSKDGVLKKTDEYDAGGWSIHYGRRYSDIIDFAVSDVDSKNLDKSKSIDLTGFLENSTSSKELVSKLQSEYTIDFRTKDSVTYESLGIGISERPSDEYNGKYLMMFLDNTYDPLCVIKDLWCGMDYDTAYNYLVRLTYNDSVNLINIDSSDGNSFQIGNDLIHIERNNGRVSWILYYKFIDRDSLGSSENDTYEVTMTDDNMEPCELYWAYNFGEISNTIETLAWNGYYFIDNGDGSCTSSDGSVIIRLTDDPYSFYAAEPNISIYPSDNNKYSILSCYSGMTEDEGLSALLQQYHVIPTELPEECQHEGYTMVSYQLDTGNTRKTIAFHIKDGYIYIIDFWYNSTLEDY